MANEIVLPLKSVDRLGELLAKSASLTDLLQVAAESGDEVKSETLANTTWLLSGLLSEARGLLMGSDMAAKTGRIEALIKRGIERGLQDAGT